MSDEQWFIRGIMAAPQEQTNWLTYADWLGDHSDPREHIVRAIGTALNNGTPIEALPHLRQFFAPDAETPLDTTHANNNYANYLLAAGDITDNRLTLLQGQYMADYLRHCAENPDYQNTDLLRLIREEAGILLGPVGFQRISTQEGTINFNFDNLGIQSPPPGFHASGSFQADRCTAIEIEDGFHAGKNAHFAYCPQLTGIGKHFYCGGEAVLSQSRELTHLGDGFTAHTLFLNNSGITGFPKDIEIRGRILDIPDSFTNDNLLEAYRHRPKLSHLAHRDIGSAIKERDIKLGK